MHKTKGLLFFSRVNYQVSPDFLREILADGLGREDKAGTRRAGRCARGGLKRQDKKSECCLAAALGTPPHGEQWGPSCARGGHPQSRSGGELETGSQDASMRG